MLSGALDEGRAHVDADLIDRLGVTAMCGQVIGEGSNGAGILALGGEQHTGLVNIDEQRDVVVAAPGGGLIDGDPGHRRSVGPRPRLIHIVMQHAPQPCVVLAHHLRRGPNRHGRDHGHQERLKQQSEAAVGSCPEPATGLDPVGTWTFLMPHLSQRTRGTRALR